MKRGLAQVVCMQEVQSDHLKHLVDVFGSMGYEVVYQARTGGKTDGCLIMFKKDYFKLVAKKTFCFYRNGSNLLFIIVFPVSVNCWIL